MSSPSSSPKSTTLMLVLIVGLTIACVALLVALVNKDGDSADAATDAETAGEVSAEPEQPRSPSEQWPRSDDAGAGAGRHPWERDLRLPRLVLPLHYDLYLYPDLERGLFMGTVDVHVENRYASRDHFILHAKHLDILYTRVYSGSDASDETRRINLLETVEYKKHEFLVLRTNQAVPRGKYILSVEFRGNLTRGITGFYRSVYRNSAGQDVPIATSKFQPTDARAAFPCFDEPSFKSTFNVTLVRPSQGYVALSNMPVETETQDAPARGVTEVKFQKSVPMVTYLACFIVCDFAYEEKYTSVHRTKFRVYATPNQKDRVQYALDIGANITDYFEDYFKIGYPLPKQDMIAIPDFSSGAMEHWGLITYRETALLYDSRESSSYNQQRVGTVVSHELAHQWFGNLVTLSWWDDLWLNEGFASYIEYKGLDNYHKDWNVLSHFHNLDLHRVMDLDSTLNSHPIIQKVENPDQITEIFDAISYSKGASVLRMLESFMGAEPFRQGVSNFLARFQYANAVTNDLWTELTNVTKANSNGNSLDITKIMDTWTRQMGYPVLKVESIGPGHYRLRQSRYLRDPSSAVVEPSPYDYKWDVPVTFITNEIRRSKSNNNNLRWLNRKDVHMDVRLPEGTSWVKFNVDQLGYYRVNYPAREWSKFSELLINNHEELSAMDRSSLINDAFSLAQSSHLDYSVPLSMIQYMQAEQEKVPWSTAYRHLADIEGLLMETEAYPEYREYILSLVETRYRQLGWSDVGSHNEKLNRGTLLNLACRNAHSDCLEQAGKLFKEWVENQAYIAPNLRTIVYKYGMQSRGDAQSWKVMLERYKSEINAQEKRKLMGGLANTNQPWILKQFLRLAEDETIVRKQDYLSALSAISANPVGNPIAWDFLRENWPRLVDRFGLNSRYLGRVPKIVSSNFATQFQLDEMKAFFAKYPEAGAGTRSRKQALEQVENNIKWLNRHQANIRSWLKKNQENNL